MKVFVTGVNGQLGHDVMKELNRRRFVGVGSGRAPISSDLDSDPQSTDISYVQLDITDAPSVCQTIEAFRPDVVIHCAAWTAVDNAELPENRNAVRAINEIGTINIAQCCAELDCKMIYVSTDYVFGGQGEKPWEPECKDYAPLNWYGQTKLQGEFAVAEMLKKFFIVRTAWVFGENGGNFVKTMLKLGKTHDNLRVVTDQIGTPTYTPDLARLLVDMAETEKYGYYHAVNEGGYISWYDFAREIFRAVGYSVQVTPVTTAEYGLSKAVRPFNSRLDTYKLMQAGFTPLPDWKDALYRFLQIYKENNDGTNSGFAM